MSYSLTLRSRHRQSSLCTYLPLLRTPSIRKTETYHLHRHLHPQAQNLHLPIRHKWDLAAIYLHLQNELKTYFSVYIFYIACCIYKMLGQRRSTLLIPAILMASENIGRKTVVDVETDLEPISHRLVDVSS